MGGQQALPVLLRDAGQRLLWPGPAPPGRGVGSALWASLAQEGAPGPELHPSHLPAGPGGDQQSGLGGRVWEIERLLTGWVLMGQASA